MMSLSSQKYNVWEMINFLVVAMTLVITIPAQAFTKAEINAFEHQLESYESSYDPGNDPCAIYFSVSTGKQGLVKYAVDQAKKSDLLKQQINCTGNATKTPLGLAVEMKNIDIARFLIRSGADVNSTGQAQNPPLYDAIENGDIPMVKLLLDSGARKDVYAGDIPSDILEPEKDLSMTAIIAHDKDDETSRELLEKSVSTRNVEATKRLLGLGIDPDTPLSDDEINALMELSGSVREEESDVINTEMTRALIEHGADVKKTEEQKDQSLLMGPVQKDFVDMARTLLGEGADPQKRVSDPSRPTTMEKANPRIRSRSAVPPATTSPLEEAEKIGDEEMIELLRQYSK